MHRTETLLGWVDSCAMACLPMRALRDALRDESDPNVRGTDAEHLCIALRIVTGVSSKSRQQAICDPSTDAKSDYWTW